MSTKLAVLLDRPAAQAALDAIRRDLERHTEGSFKAALSAGSAFREALASEAPEDAVLCMPRAAAALLHELVVEKLGDPPRDGEKIVLLVALKDRLAEFAGDEPGSLNA